MRGSHRATESSQRTTGASCDSTSASSLGHGMALGAGGAGRLIDALVAMLQEHGGQVVTGAEIDGLYRCGAATWHGAGVGAGSGYLLGNQLARG